MTLGAGVQVLGGQEVLLKECGHAKTALYLSCTHKSKSIACKPQTGSVAGSFVFPA